MTLSRSRPAGHTPRGRGDGGTAILEFTLVAVLLFTLIFGIINFGLILSFHQDMTRAAAEGGRAAAVALPSTVVGANDTRRLAGVTATDEAVDGFNQECGVDGMECIVQIHDCEFEVPDDILNPADDLNPTPDSNGYDNNSQPDCVTVRLRFDYDSHPLIGALPIIEAFLPNEINAKSVSRLNE